MWSLKHSQNECNEYFIDLILHDYCVCVYIIDWTSGMYD